MALQTIPGVAYPIDTEDVADICKFLGIPQGVISPSGSIVWTPDEFAASTPETGKFYFVGG